MEQLIEAFGIDVKLIVIQIVNFGLLLAVLSYFLYKPVLKMLADREAKIKQGIADAEQAALAKSEAEKEKQVVLTDAHKEAGNVVERATTSADEKASSILSGAQLKAAEVLAAAEKRSIELMAKAAKDNEAEVAKVAVLAAEKILSQKTA